MFQEIVNAYQNIRHAIRRHRINAAMEHYQRQFEHLMEEHGHFWTNSSIEIANITENTVTFEVSAESGSLVYRTQITANI